MANVIDFNEAKERIIKAKVREEEFNKHLKLLDTVVFIGTFASGVLLTLLFKKMIK